jgi:SAM-dependent methyltransferase
MDIYGECEMPDLPEAKSLKPEARRLWPKAQSQPKAMFAAAFLLALGLVSASAAGQASQATPAPLDVIYVPTPHEVVARMLSVARVGPGDVVYDLGSGDGRIVIAAVKDFGAARGVGVDLDPQRITEANENARAAGVSDRVTFVAQDLFQTDLREATVITMYLLPTINARLVPTLRALRPGTRIVSHNYDLSPDWKPEAKIVLEHDLVYFWTVPRR